jgi:S-adenosylmethionine synthetase
MEPENDMLVPIRKGRPDIICDFMSNPLAVVIVKDDSRQRMRWRVQCEDSTNLLMYAVNVSTAKEDS